MNYRTTICACAALISIAPAWAQEEAASTATQAASMSTQGASTATQDAGPITIYGSIDQGVQHLSNVATGKTAAPAYQVGAGTAASFFGFRGIEDLGGGLKAVWNLEGGFLASDGVSSQGDRLFGRQAYVGLDGRFGRLTFGRQYTMRAYALSPINPFGDGSQGLTTLDNGIANPRADNAISYRVYLIGGLEAGVNYSFARDGVTATPVSVVATNCPGEPTSWQECKESSVLLKYTGNAWGVASAYERNNGGTSATYGGLTSPKLTDSRLIVGGNVLVSDVKIGVGLIKRTDLGIATPRSNLDFLSVTAPVTPYISIDGMLAELKYDQSPNKALVEVLRFTYSLSKHTSLYVTADHIQNSGHLALAASTMLPVGDPPPGGAQTSIIAGIKVKF